MASLVPIPLLEIFHDSFERCKQRGTLVELFYDRFINCSPEIARLFEQSGAERAKKMLQGSIYDVLLASGGTLTSSEKLSRLGQFHKALGARPEYYDLWLDALLSVVEEVDPKYNLEVEQAWRTVMGTGLGIMRAASDEAPPK